MRQILRITAATALLSAIYVTSAHGQEGASNLIRRATEGGDLGVGVDQVGGLGFPPELRGEGVISGEVRISISVDRDGILRDSLVTAYTEPAFANVALAAVKRWRYHPATAAGTPTAARSDLVFEFRSTGVVVQTTSPSDALLRRVYLSSLSERYQYKPCRLRDLDRIPTPVHVVNPSVNSDENAHTVTVEFYIDEDGRVRMAAVPRDAAGDVYAAAAVAAVEQWRFEPPLRKGRPVLVLAQQEFKFRPKQ